ncbi:helix-turn-helix transcriptional regulator [Parabacteroides sp. Y3-G-102]|uniref:helix-turn-helix domain-containing protein n=1 Tax=Parabacteroides TaxID=375288 RepID=UPI0015B94831|nr:MULTISPECIES: helix-turn-helix transcriptional regulator [Parabacteroides]MCM0727351.1 helix-turn-helix transcriptional regulator [Parabacteroides sp. Y3-G-102]
MEVQIDASLEQSENIIADDVDAWMLHSQTIATIMSNRMEQLGMTQKALAMKMNCSQQYISKVLKGRENLSLETLCKIEKALDIKILNSNIKVK